MDNLEYDMNTISAGDFTVEMDISKKMYEDFMDNVFEPIGSRQTDEHGKLYSPALYLKKYLSEEVSRILTNSMKFRLDL
jgi:hypothetical protein